MEEIDIKVNEAKKKQQTMLDNVIVDMAYVMGHLSKDAANDKLQKNLNHTDRLKLFPKDNKLKLMPDTIYSSK